MKTILLLIFQLSLTCLLAQNATQLGSSLGLNASGKNKCKIHMNNLGTPFVTFLNLQGKLIMKKFINGNWVNASNSLSTIASEVDEFDVSYNSTSDEFFIVYLRNDSILFRNYNTNWTNETFAGTGYWDGVETHISSCIDEASNEAYFIYKQAQNDFRIRKYNMGTSTLSNIPIPSNFNENTIYFRSADINFNPKDERLYLSGSTFNTYNTWLYRFDGSSWDNFTTSVDNQNSAHSTHIIFDTTQLYDIAVLSGLPKETQGKKYRSNSLGNYQNFQGSYMMNQFLFSDVKSFAKNYNNGYYAYTYTVISSLDPDTSFVRFYDENNWYEFEHGLGKNIITALQFRSNGKLLICAVRNYNSSLRVYEYDAFTASAKEHSASNELALYPNPASNTIKVDTKSEIQLIQIVDTRGKVVITERDFVGGTTSTVAIQSLKKGVYFAHIQTRDGFQTQKFIHQ